MAVSSIYAERWEILPPVDDEWFSMFSSFSSHDTGRNSTSRKLLQGPQAAPPTQNIAKGMDVTASSIASRTSAAAAVDGDTWGTFEVKTSHLATNEEGAPWIQVDLGSPMKVDAVELWPPQRQCERLMHRFMPDKKKQIIATMKKGIRPAHFCKPGWPSFEPSQGRPLQVQLLRGSQVVAQMAFTSRATVWSWGDINAEAQVIRVSVGQGGDTALHLTEIKVYGPRGEKSCKDTGCGRGSCTAAGTCACSGPMMGPECEYNIQGVETYLPHDPNHGWWEDSSLAMYQAHVMSLQRNCQEPRHMRKHVILPGAGGMGAGLGSTMFFRTGVMTEAVAQNSAYLYYGKFNYALSDYCKGLGQYGTFECYFQPMIPCQGITETLRQSFKFPSPNKKGPKGEDCLVPDRKGHTSEGCNAGPEFMSVPRQFQRFGIFWWRMMQTAHLMRPTVQTMEAMNLPALKKQIGFEHPIIGVHMRSGDGCRYGIRARLFDCRTLKDYLPDIRALSMKYGTDRVFLSTDDQQAIQDTKLISEFNWVVVPSDRSAFNSNVKIEQRLTGTGGPGINQHTTMISTLQDLFLLAESDYMVTHQASTMSRLALMFGTMFHRRIPPFISMDGPWCPHWRMCCDPNHKTGASLEC